MKNDFYPGDLLLIDRTFLRIVIATIEREGEQDDGKMVLIDERHETFSNFARYYEKCQ